MTTTVDVEALTPTSKAVRFVDVRANLLPDEVVVARRTARLRNRILIALVALVVALAGWYAFCNLQTARAKDDLATLQRHGEALQGEQRQFTPLIEAQAQSARIKTALAKLMSGDLRWQDLLARLRSAAPRGVALATVDGNLAATADTAANGGLNVLNGSGKPAVGQLTITGRAPDKGAIANYVDRLGRITGLAAPFPASVTGKDGSVTFSLTVIITADALGGRYTPDSATSLGGN